MLSMVLNIRSSFTIDGESLISGYEKHIDVLDINHSLSMGMLYDKSSNSRTSGRSDHGDFECVMRLNKAFPKLFEACSKGTNLGDVQLFLLKMTEGKIGEVAKYEMKHTFVSSLQIHPRNSRLDGKTSELPCVTLKLNYQKMGVTYTEYDERGASKGTVACQPMSGLGD